MTKKSRDRRKANRIFKRTGLKTLTMRPVKNQEGEFIATSPFNKTKLKYKQA